MQAIRMDVDVPIRRREDCVGVTLGPDKRIAHFAGIGVRRNPTLAGVRDMQLFVAVRFVFAIDQHTQTASDLGAGVSVAPSSDDLPAIRTLEFPIHRGNVIRAAARIQEISEKSCCVILSLSANIESVAEIHTAKIMLSLTPRLRQALNKKAKQDGVSTQALLRAIAASAVGMAPNGKVKR
jgi:hypothetical protein